MLLQIRCAAFIHASLKLAHLLIRDILFISTLRHLDFHITHTFPAFHMGTDILQIGCIIFSFNQRNQMPRKICPLHLLIVLLHTILLIPHRMYTTQEIQKNLPIDRL